MMPSNSRYPEFVPDQVLSSDSLNDLFGYLDEQARLTRTNLLGVGIVCGLEVHTKPDGTQIRVTKGTGITTEGYQIVHDDTVYSRVADFDPQKAVHYEKFVDASKTKKFALWELKQAAAGEGDPLTLSFLNGNGVDSEQKVVLLFLELLEEHNKNCDPESCDDKGMTIQVNVRPLLVRKADVKDQLDGGIGEIVYHSAFAALPQLRLRRFDVPAAVPTNVSTAGLLTAYRKILTPTFLQRVEDTLSKAWTQFKAVVGDEYAGQDPFIQVAENLAFVNSAGITDTQLRNLQYAYDHVGDLLAAYAEFRQVGLEALSLCCPDAGLFPRHLLLDPAIKDADQMYTGLRHHFRRSPLFGRCDLLGRLRSLFRRLVLLRQRFQVPAVEGATSNPDDFIRITPSNLDDLPLSRKAIPFYYRAADPPGDPLFKQWDYDRTQSKDAEGNLSYHAATWSQRDEVGQPLLFDLEPFNFLRIEGHVGKPFAHVLSNLRRLIKERRLPIDVLTLALGTDASTTQLTDPKLIEDLQSQYEVLRAEAVCCLRDQVRYWGTITPKDSFAYGTLKGGLLQAVVGESKAAAAVSAELEVGTAPTKAATSISGEAASKAPAKKLSAKGETLLSLMGSESITKGLLATYFQYQQGGELKLSDVPPPREGLSDTVVAHFALQIVDAIGELLLLLNSADAQSLNVDALERNGQDLDKAVSGLLERIEKELNDRRPYQKVRAYVGSAQQARVDAIEAAMPELSEADANTLVLLLLNLAEGDKSGLANQIALHGGNPANQTNVINLYFSRLDKNTMVVPVDKRVSVIEEPFLREVRDRLRMFTCLCLLQGFRKLAERLRARVDELKRLNLFGVFADKHPGLQHKAGVTPGGTFLVVYHRKSGKAPDNPDPNYEKVVDAFPDGMVVADFYLPYRCSSPLPPVVFQVVEGEPAPDKVELTLQPNPQTSSLNFSVRDDSDHPFAHVPDNGMLTNANSANGVTLKGADRYVFTPSLLKPLLGSNFKVDLSFQYVKRGVSSPEVKVAVFNQPTASIHLSSGSSEVAPGARVNLASTVQHGDTFEWRVKDQTGERAVGRAATLSRHLLEAVGTYSFQLIVSQSQTGAQVPSNTVTVTVKQPADTSKSPCQLPTEVVKAFRELPVLDQEGFSKFAETVLKELGLPQFFTEVEALLDKPIEEQRAFFEDRKAAELFTSWLRSLAAIASSAKRGRVLPLETYRLVVGLLLYFFCSRKRDLNLTEVDLQPFTDLKTQLDGPAGGQGLLDLFRTLPANEQAALKRLEQDLKAELERQKALPKGQSKPNFRKALTSVVGVFRI